MFIKRLRFSITSLILIAITINCNSSFAQVIKNITTNGWTLQNSNTYPPKVNNERYLYFVGKTMDLKGLKIEVKSIPPISEGMKLDSASVTFDYWGYGGEVIADYDGYSATSFFSLGVSFQSEARPQTVWAAFDESTLGNKGGDSWATFTATSTDPIYPARIMITPVQTDTEEFYYVALKAINVNYNFNYSETVTTNKSGTETNVTQHKTKMVSLTCDSSACGDFILTSNAQYYWSDLYLPTKPKAFSKFYTPNNRASSYPLSLTVTKTELSDACISVNYWLTDGARLTVTMASSTATLTLSPTYLITSISDNSSKYEWYTAKFCLSHYFFNLPSGDYDLSFEPSPVNAPDYIAIGEITESDTDSPALSQQTGKMILESWSKNLVSPTNEWRYLPSAPVSSSTSDLSFKLVPSGNGIIYIISDWFTMASGLALRENMTITSCPSIFNATLQVIDSGNNIIDLQHLELCSTTTDTSMEKVYSIAERTIGQIYRLQFVIYYKENDEAESSTLTLSAVDLSDACRLDREECSNHGDCVVKEPNIANCVCDSGYLLEKCSKPDYCVLTFEVGFSTTQINGTYYCDERGGNCTKETFDPDTRRICDCGLTKYWKFDESLGHSCANLEPCTGIDAFCPTGYVCDYDSTTNAASCSACDTNNNYVKNATGHCVKSDPCTSKNCSAGASCTTYPNGDAVCYCENGVVYDASNGCDTETCSWEMREELGCNQTCTVELGKAECACFPGYNLTLNSDTDCEKDEDFDCTFNCSSIAGSICVLDENSAESLCACPSGNVMVNSGTAESKCVNICEGASLNNTDAIDQVKSICGTSSCNIDKNNVLICDCGSPYVRTSNGRCKIDTSCLSGGQGYSECSTRGAVCQPNLEAVLSNGQTWKCVCPIGTYQAANGSCVDQCSDDSKSCLFDNAVCQKSTVLGASSHDCVCQPGLKKGSDNKCYLIEHSLRIEMVVRLEDTQVASTETLLQRRLTSYYMVPAVTDTCSKYASLDIAGCVDYLAQAAREKTEMQKPAAMEAAIREMLKTTLKEDLANVYGSTFGDINIITYSKLMSDSSSLGGDYRAIISVELTDPNIDTKSHLTSFNDEAVCHSFPETIAEASSYCFIPTRSVLQRNSIVQTDLMPCNETYINYCPANTQCVTLDYSRFACDCNPGFKAETIIQMDKDKRSSYKEYCEDIDECSAVTSPCRQHSTCINTIGGYECPCNHEYIEDTESKSCISVCSTTKCIYGECYVVANNTGACRCHEGYRGETCEDVDPLVTTFRTALITVAVVLGLLLIGVVLVAVILIKKTKKSAMKKNAERPMAEYGRPQVPKRYQDNSGFIND